MQGYFENYGLKAAFAICIIILGAAVTWLLCFILKKVLYKTKVEAASVTFITAIFKIIMAIAIVLICASVLELSTSSLIVSLSTIALAVGLALKDSFANLANGILIIANKPFKRGDYISVAGVDGKVQNIRLLTVELITFNNTKIILPNSTLLNDNVISYSAMPVRRVDMTYSVAYGSDMDKVEKILHKICLNNPKILNDI